MNWPTFAQTRGQGNEFPSALGSKWCSRSGRRRRKLMISVGTLLSIAQAHHSSRSTASSRCVAKREPSALLIFLLKVPSVTLFPAARILHPSGMRYSPSLRSRTSCSSELCTESGAWESSSRKSTPSPSVGRKMGGFQRVAPFSTDGTPRKSTGSSRTARISISGIFISAATLATICDLPIPGGPQRNMGTLTLSPLLRMAIASDGLTVTEVSINSPFEVDRASGAVRDVPLKPIFAL